MFDVNEILARLQDGDSVEDVAAEMTKALNAAEQKFQEEKEKAEKAAEIAALEKEVKLNDLVETILLAVDEYLRIKSPEFADTFAEESISVAEFREMLDDLVDSFTSALTLSSKLQKLGATSKTADDKIADFLKSMGL